MEGKKHHEFFTHTGLTTEELMSIVTHEYRWMYGEFPYALVMHPRRLKELHPDLRRNYLSMLLIQSTRQLGYDTILCLSLPVQEVLHEKKKYQARTKTQSAVDRVVRP